MLTTLQRRERMIATVRWIAAAFALLQVTLYTAPAGVDPAAAARARPFGYALVAALVLVGLVVEVALRVVRSSHRLMAVGAAVLVADTAVTVGFVYLYAFDPVSSLWSAMVLLPLEGALRFELRGAVGVWLALVPTYLAREVLGARLTGTAIVVGSATYRLGLLLVVSLFAGLIARDLHEQRRLLQRLNDASHVVASRLEPAEILEALCHQSVECLGAQSAVVYAYDGSWFHPVASYPADDLITVMAEDEQEREDAALVPLLLRRPAWLEADARRPGRLVVPLRWQTATTTNLLVLRPSGGRPTPFETDVAASLAESAALALATTRVIAAEQRSVRRLQYLEALRTRFVATIAHDLRLPLTVFKGASQMLRNRRDALDPQVIDRMLRNVERQANRMSRLADDLLDAARLDEDLLQLHTADVDLSEVIAATIADAEDDVQVQLDGDLHVLGDEARLERVLWNLLSNAEKYGKPPVQIHGWRENGMVKVAVRDHGAGLDEEHRQKLFTEFAGNDDPDSVGLGLSIVWQLVDAHGGDVHYRDAEPGACFEVVLPVAGPPQKERLTAGPPPAPRP